jgi:hypothetical protein
VWIGIAFGTTIGVAFSGKAQDAATTMAANGGNSFFIIVASFLDASLA